MKKINVKTGKIFASLIMSVAAAAVFATPEFVCKTDKDPLSYSCGEEMNFKISFVENGKPVEGTTLKWSIHSDDGKIARGGTAVSAKEPLELSAKCDVPGFVFVKVLALGKDGKKIRFTRESDKRVLDVSFYGGAGADVEKIATSEKEPADFDAFWARQLKLLSKNELHAKQQLLPEYSKGDFNTYELTVASRSLPAPAKAFLSVPKGAVANSLPMRVEMLGYGAGRVLPSPHKDCISVKIERHSYELLREPEYYTNLKKGALKRFGLDAKGNEDPENSYFKFMILRDLLVMKYLKGGVAEWNGKDLTVAGGSMGGFQAIFVAGLDKDVSMCVPHIPWMTDLWASEFSKRQPSVFRPDYTPAIRYFDSTIMIKRVRCPVMISAWLGDYVCPPAGIMALYNNANAPKSISFGQNGIHGGFLGIGAKIQYSKLEKK